MTDSVIYRDRNAYGKKKKIKVVSAIDKVYLEETYRDMAANGWLVENVKGLFDGYRPIEPCDLEFEVTLFQPVTALDYPDKDKEETYQEFCEDEGWVLAAKNERYFIYYKVAGSKVTPIHTDPEDEYRSVANAMKKSEMLAFPILLLSQFLSIWVNLRTFRYENYLEPMGLFSIIYPLLFCIIITAYMMPMFMWLIQNRSRARDNKPLIYSSYKVVRVRNGLYNGALFLMLLYLISSVADLVTDGVPSFVFIIAIMTLIIPFAIGMLIRYKIKKIKHSRTVNSVVVVIGLIVAYALMIGTMILLFSANNDYVTPQDEIPDGVAIVTHEDFGSDLVFQPRYVDVDASLMAPLSFSYNSWHRSDEGDFGDIDLIYIEARNEWAAKIIANRVIEDERVSMEREKPFLESQGMKADYLYPIEGYNRSLDLVYNLSHYNNEVMMRKGKVIYILRLDGSIDDDVLNKVVEELFGL